MLLIYIKSPFIYFDIEIMVYTAKEINDKNESVNEKIDRILKRLFSNISAYLVLISNKLILNLI